MDFTPGSINRKFLNQEFFQEKYSDFRKWYFATHTPSQLEEYKLQYYLYLEEIQVLYPFSLWYLSNIQPPKDSVQVLEAIQQKWTTTDGRTILSIHPPTQPLELQPTSTTTANGKPMVIAAFTELPHREKVT